MNRPGNESGIAAEGTVRVVLGERSYDIMIGDGALSRAGGAIRAVTGGRAPVVITDENVAPHHLGTLGRVLADVGIALDEPIILPAGESTKSLSQFCELMETILERGVERSTKLLALGGGVIGDLVGYTAASLLRGVDFIQVPTTLLSQVDSSVGGKTGINSRHGKNLIGAFHQPRLVIADTRTLDTLPRREVLAGYAEVVKYAAIGLPDFLDWLEANGGRVVAGEADARAHAVAVSCRSKAAIVAADERESGERALLNLGHTFGHVLEAATGFGDGMLHGEAVAIGMTMAFDLSVRMGFCPAEDARRLRAHLASVGLPLAARDFPSADWGGEWDAETLVAHMSRDKKVANGRVTFILPRGIGRTFTCREVPQEAVREVMAAWVAGNEA